MFSNFKSKKAIACIITCEDSLERVYVMPPFRDFSNMENYRIDKWVLSSKEMIIRDFLWEPLAEANNALVQINAFTNWWNCELLSEKLEILQFDFPQ